MSRGAANELPAVTLSEDGAVRYLHLGTEWIQGTMRIDQPFDIELEYVQRMMAWLLFIDLETVPRRRALQLGLGAGALTKFCFKKLRMDTTAVDINPQVIAACRTWFRLPPDSAQLKVMLGDAAEVAGYAPFHGAFDAVQVDLYDHEAAAPVLDSADFYADCRRLLTDDGAMTVNLFGRQASYERSLGHIRQAFGDAAVWAFRPTREGNTVVLALRTPQAPDRLHLLKQAEAVQARWGLPARKWLKVFKPLQG